MEQKIALLADMIVQSERMVILTGAGISTESGIPDFRGPDGIWEQYDPSDFTYQKFVKSAETRQRHWQFYRSGTLGAENAQPNPAHYAIADLHRMGKLTCLITQNIDNLHQMAGFPDERVIELHGNMRWVKCLGCGDRRSMEEVLKRVEEQDLEEPRCELCDGILKPEGIFFGESLPETELREATRFSRNSDVFIVIGSSLVVTPAAYMPSYALRSGARLAIVNIGSTPLDSQATLLIEAKAGEVLPAAVGIVKGQAKSN